MNLPDFSAPIEEEVYDPVTEKWIIKGSETIVGSKQTNYFYEEEIFPDNTEQKNLNPKISKLWETRLDTLKGVETVLDFDIELLTNLSRFSNSIISRGNSYSEQQIIIPFDILDLVNSKIGIDTQKYISNTEFKKKILEVLALKGTFGFFIEFTDKGITEKLENTEDNSGIFSSFNKDTTEFNLVLIPMNLDENRGEASYKNSGFSKYNLEYIFTNVLFLETEEKRLNFVKSVVNRLDLSELSDEEVSNFYSSGNYLNFIFQKLIKEIFFLSSGTIDKEISLGLAGYILREYFDIDFTELKEFFQIIAQIVKVPNGENEIIYISLNDLKRVIESKNISIQKYISNPLFKQKIRETLKLDNNYGFIVDEEKSNILMVPIKKDILRYAGVEKGNIDFIISDILKLDTREKRNSFINSIIPSIDLIKNKEELNDKFSSKNYLKYIFNEVSLYIFNHTKANFDLDMARGVAGALFREDFDFVNSNMARGMAQSLFGDKYDYINNNGANNFVIDFSSKLGLQLLKAYKIDSELAIKFKKSLSLLEKLLKQNLGLKSKDIEVNNFRNSFSNDIFKIFSENIKNLFKRHGISDIDDHIVKGLFIYVVHNNGSKENPMNDFTELVFSKITTKTEELSKLFAFFSSSVVKIGNEKYNYSNLKFRDIEIKDEEYSVEKVFNIIKQKLERFDELPRIIAETGRYYNETTRFLDLTNKSIETISEEMPILEAELTKLNSELDNLNKNIPTGFHTFLKKKKHLKKISDLEESKKGLESSLSNKKSNLVNLQEEKKQYESRLSLLDESVIKVKRLEEEKKLLEEEIKRLKEDFSNNLFFGLRED